MNVLHLSFFYPDEVEPVTTHAIKRLIDCADAFAANQRISLHRFLPRDGIHVRAGAGHTIVCERLRAFPYGMRDFLARCAGHLDTVLATAGPFDLTHAHLLTMEGELALRIKQRYGVPFVASVRATDFVLFRFKPYMKRRYLEIIDASERLILIAPWMAGALARVFGRQWTEARARKITFLYNIVDGPNYWQPAHNGRYVLPIVAHRSQLRRKRIEATLRALAALRDRGRHVALDVFGDGDGMRRIVRWVEHYALQSHVTFKGVLPNEKMIRVLSEYKALFLCSMPETFGLVYIEALKAGIPIVYSEKTGIDGVFPGTEIGVTVADRSPNALADAFAAMEARHPEYKLAVRELQASNALAQFTSGHVERRLRELYTEAAASASDTCAELLGRQAVEEEVA